MSNAFDWNDLMQAADDAGFTVVPAMKGVAARIATANAAKTSNGKDQIKVRFVLTEGPYANKSVFNNFVISTDNGTALGFFFRHMAALGLSREWFATKPTMAQVAAALVDRTCVLDISVRDYQGTERNQVDNVLPPRNGGNAAPQTVIGSMPTPGVPGPVPTTGPVPSFPMPTPSAAQPVPTVTAPPPMATPAPLPMPAPLEVPEQPEADATPPKLPF